MSTGGGRRAVFLDRDGVLNGSVVRGGKPYPPASLDETVILPGVMEACSTLRAAGFLLLVVTNQPDIARGATTETQVGQINGFLQAQLGLDEVLMCPHDDADKCSCRKPKPGLLVAAAQRLGIDLSASFMVGDRWRDIGAGRAAGCRTVFIDMSYAERQPEKPDLKAMSLVAAVPWILGLHLRS